MRSWCLCSAIRISGFRLLPPLPYSVPSVPPPGTELSPCSFLSQNCVFAPFSFQNHIPVSCASLWENPFWG